MINKIRIQNCFRHPDTTIEFKDGLTGIFGANEAGKSLIFEMISYALFGSVALRGSAPDYKKLIVTLDFMVNGLPYQVYRAGTKALLTRNGKELATGQKPINTEIVRILGYDYKVFCVANYSPQGELCNLSRMKPAERKSMVDNVVGLGIIDKVIESIANNSRELNSKINGMNAILIEPMAPEMPENYRSATLIQEAVTKISKSVEDFNFVDRWLRQPQPEEPVVPVIPHSLTKDELLKIKADHDAKSQRGITIQGLLSKYVPAAYSKEELEAMAAKWTDFHRKNELLAKSRGFIQKPDFTKEDLDNWQEQAAKAKRWQTKLRLEAMGENECPSCHHTWFLQSEQLAAYADAVETAEPPRHPSAPDYSLCQLYENQKTDREKLASELEKLIDVKMPDVALSDINNQLANIDKQDEMAELKKESDALLLELEAPCLNYHQMIKDWDNYELSKAKFETLDKAYNAWEAEYAIKYKQWEQLKNMPATLTALQQELRSAQVYEQILKNYQIQHQTWLEQSAKVDELRFELSQMEKAREAMRNLRISVKKFLVPSLNKVASYLLSQMTGGARNIIDINEDFDISVDGQALSTLSGSGQAVSNLAIRIALGQVLIAKKFPIFMADEIDGDMDEERAGFTAECLRRITKHVNQFLLISHKRPLADNYIELGRA